MRIQRVIPPAAVPIPARCLLEGFLALFHGKRVLEKREGELRQYFGVKHVFLLSSGKAALTVILRALKQHCPDRDEVLIPAYTCFSVPSAIVKAGLKVALCDIDPATFDFDDRLLEGSINDRTLCVVPDHLFGIPANMDRIIALCRTKGVLIVEDASQAMGGRYRDQWLGTLGDVGFFSLGRGKNLTCGSGGIIITNSDSIAAKIREEYERLEYPSLIEIFREFLKVMLLMLFMRPSLYWFPAGLPFLRLGETIFYRDFPIKRLSGMQASLLKDWQPRLERANEWRRQISTELKKTFHINLLRECIPYLRFPVLVESHAIRDTLFFKKKPLGLSCMYPVPVNEIKEIGYMFVGKLYPCAKDVSERILTIPTHQFVSIKDRRMLHQAFSVNWKAVLGSEIVVLK